MKLYFCDEFMKEVETEKEAFKEISAFLKKCNYKSYYTRYYIDNEGVMHIDVGSHSQFFYLKP